jgi:glycine/D-amino acid oxidase-like deaminating enzyme
MLDRRDLLRLLAAGGATACTSRIQPPDNMLARPRLRLPPVNVAPDREIRTVVGLRPFRPTGFVVRADKLGEKLVVHNYGHGGGGVTLSWGTAHLATRAALESGAKRMAVLGCGAVGLATARLLQLAGVRVTIYAAALPPETTSHIAGAQVFPFTVYDPGYLVPPFREQFLVATEFSFRWYQALVGELYGVRWMRNYLVTPRRPNEDGLTGLRSPIRHLLPELRDLPAGEHPFHRNNVRQFDTMIVEPSIYLPQLMRDFRVAGGDFVVQRFDSVEQVVALTEPVVINCTGLGAGALFGDDELTPIKGQLTVLLPQREVDYAVLAGDLYMFSRRDGVLLGGTHERGVTTLDPNLDAKQRVLDGHARLFDF